MRQIVIVEDDRDLNRGLCRALKEADCSVVSCHDLREARRQLALGGVSLLLLDIGLPDGSGLELLREVKQRTPGLPVILLTANDTDEDIVGGLESGADDYITKPFSLSVLRARVNNQLRKTAAAGKRDRYQSGRFCFDFAEMKFLADGEPVYLSKTEQRLLHLLTECPGMTLKRGMLIDRIWTDGAEFVDENALSVTVKRLRDKLGAQREIKTVYGIGYAWVDQNG